MYKLIKLIITVIAIISILCCVPVASAVDATEPTEATSEQATEHPAEQEEDNHNVICCILLAIGVPSGCLIAQGFSFWKW
jgi:hypothetical protein